VRALPRVSASAGDADGSAIHRGSPRARVAPLARATTGFLALVFFFLAEIHGAFDPHTLPRVDEPGG